jgi:hypothetical protein
MKKRRGEHTSAEFGQMPSGGIKGLDAPMIGAPVSLTLDGIVERESGVTPDPPVVSVKAMLIVLGIMLVLGILLVTLVPILSPPPPLP